MGRRFNCPKAAIRPSMPDGRTTCSSWAWIAGTGPPLPAHLPVVAASFSFAIFVLLCVLYVDEVRV
jgi:hypothetical protein